MMGLKCYFDHLWCHDVTYWLDHFGSLRSVLFWDTFRLLVGNRSVLWFIWDTSWLLVENQWIMWYSLRCILGFSLRTNAYCDIYFEILYGCSLRTNGYCDYHWCLQLHLDNCCDHDYQLVLFSCSWRFWCSYFRFIFWYFLSSHLYRTEVIFWFMIPWA